MLMLVFIGKNHMKKFVIHTPNGINPSQKLQTKQAVEEFISMFPEYRNSFKVEFRDDANVTGKEIDQAQYDALPDNEQKRKFIKSSRGTWLVPHQSMEWYILSSQNSNGEINVQNVAKLHGERISEADSNEIPICIVNGNVSPFCYGYTGGTITTFPDGRQVENSAVILSAKNCGNDPEFFKTIVIHELGHVFNATHSGRAHTVQQNGPHCTNALCIMGASNYQQLRDERLRRKNNVQPPFCDECIESMREYMSHMPELVREVHVERFRGCLPVLPHNNDNWKNDYRTFYQNVAQRDGDTYVESPDSVNYLARIKRADGSTLEIEANNEYNVALGATNTSDGTDVPSLKDMRDLVKLAQSKNSGMDFAADNDPEFNARLLIACLEARPAPLKMRNQPEVTPEFLAQLKPETKRLLQATLNPQQPQRSQNTR